MQFKIVNNESTTVQNFLKKKFKTAWQIIWKVLYVLLRYTHINWISIFGHSTYWFIREKSSFSSSFLCHASWLSVSFSFHLSRKKFDRLHHTLSHIFSDNIPSTFFWTYLFPCFPSFWFHLSSWLSRHCFSPNISKSSMFIPSYFVYYSHYSGIPTFKFIPDSIQPSHTTRLSKHFHFYNFYFHSFSQNLLPNTQIRTPLSLKSFINNFSLNRSWYVGLIKQFLLKKKFYKS